MGYKDLHEKPFDESTIVKLELFQQYCEAWLPTFVMRGEPKICIIDFFAGTGYDKNNVAGSPIRILQTIKKFVGHIFQKEIKVEIYFNEFKKPKFEQLKESCEKYLTDNSEVKRAISKIEYLNLDFKDCFNNLLKTITDYPSLVYLDQNGIKFLSLNYLLALEKTVKTDFLYFISSSYFTRFGETEEFKKHLDIDISYLKENPYKYIHNNLLEELKKKLPVNTKLKLYPFTIKKGANIYGIIFGAKSVRAIEKFLNVAWKQNPINGNANFDIDDDSSKNQIPLFGGKRKTKLELFNENLENYVKEHSEILNKEIYFFSLEEGHPPNHASSHLKSLKKEGKISFEGRSPKITFKSLKKGGDIVKIKWEK